MNPGTWAAEAEHVLPGPAGVPSGLQQGGFSGRVAELAVLAACRAEAAAGSPWVLAVEGEAGIGKSALVRQALAPGVDGLRVLWARSDPAEQDLPFGVVGQIVRRLPSGLTGSGQLSRGPAAGASPFSVGSELLQTLAEAAEDAPLAVVVDDLLWADEPSVRALAFVLRRVFAERLLVVVTTRPAVPADGVSRPGTVPGQDWHDLAHGAAQVRHVRLSGLGEEETEQLLAAAGIEGLPAAAVARLHQHTGGHPLHLQSLLKQVSVSQLADVSNPLPVPTSLEAVIRQALEVLPKEARILVEALAVLDKPVPLATAGHLGVLSDAPRALAPALACGLVAWQPDEPTTPVWIHHQLQRNAVYHALAPARRQALHAEAATLVSEEAAWAHRVAGAQTCDPVLAERLAEEAERQADRSFFGRAATLELWAADLALTRDSRERHVTAAAVHLFAALDIRRAKTLRGILEACAPSAARDAALGYLAAELDGDFVTADQLLGHAVEDTTDPTIHLNASVWLGTAHTLRANGVRAAEVLRPVVDQLPSGPFRHHAHGMLALADGYADGVLAGLAVLDEANLPSEAGQVSPRDSRLLSFRGVLRGRAGQLDACIDDLTVLADRQRADSTIPAIPHDASSLGWGQYFVGRWEDAAISAERALLIAESNQQPWGFVTPHSLAAIVHAQHGRWADAHTRLRESSQRARLFPELTWIFPVVAAATIAQARNDYSALRDAVRTVHTPLNNLGSLSLNAMLWVPLFVEAATVQNTADDLDHVDAAMGMFDQLVEHAPALGTTSHWLNARIAIARGDAEKARDSYLQAIALPAVDTDDIPLHRAFAHRDYASLLLAAGPAADRREAAVQLQEALRIFTKLGASPYAERAIQALARLGTTAPAGGRATALAVLTEREHAVAHLAAQGHTNQEIARELFVSAKTVEYHLSHVYTKLDVTGRRQLRSVGV